MSLWVLKLFSHTSLLNLSANKCFLPLITSTNTVKLIFPSQDSEVHCSCIKLCFVSEVKFDKHLLILFFFSEILEKKRFISVEDKTKKKQKLTFTVTGRNENKTEHH